MKEIIRIATRGSQLAATQTGQIADMLRERNPGYDFETVTFKTTGDKVTDRPLSSFRGTGVFVKELRSALMRGEADLAVHSLKDVPTEHFDGLVLAACPRRADSRDVLLTRGGSGLTGLSSGALVGTGSPRRIVQLRAARPDLRFADLRGNVDTRIRKLQEGQFEAIVVAAAGMARLGKVVPNEAFLPTGLCLPAAGQGALALECRQDDQRLRLVIATINDQQTFIAADCERDFVREIGGGCAMPIAALAQVQGEIVKLECMIGDPESGRIVREAGEDAVGNGGPLSKRMAERMRELCRIHEIRLL